MTVGQIVGVEHLSTASPVWLHLVDTFTGNPPTGPIEVGLRRRVGATWVPFEFRHQYSSKGDLALLGLGRVGHGQAGTTFVLRITLGVARSIVETPAGGDTIELTITTWNDDSPPAPAVRGLVRCFPGPEYPFRPGVPVHAGRIVDAAGEPAAGARVRVTETVLANTVVEEVRTGAGGWFRLPLRWSSGSTTLDADRAGQSGSTTITLPADLGSVSVISIS
jgi:hypothetical protein